MRYARPASVACNYCGKVFGIGPIGRVPRFCKPSCRVAYCARGKHARLSAEEKQRRIAWNLLIDAGIVARDQPLPPMRKEEGAP